MSVAGLNILKRHPYHMPRNATSPEEIEFLLKRIDIRRTAYSFKEIKRMLLIEEVKTIIDDISFFEKIHSGLARKLSTRFPSLYERFLKDPDRYYDTIIGIQYTSRKTLDQIWSELARDVADFTAYCGLLPCYFKNPFGRTELDGYLVTDELARFQRGELLFEEVLMNFKYPNASINLARYPDFNICVRPYYAALKICSLLKDKLPAPARLLTHAVCTLRGEHEIDAVVNELLLLRRGDEWVIPDFIGQEASRSSSVIFKALEYCGLVTRTRVRQGYMIEDITQKGEDILEKTPPQATFYANPVNGSIKLTPLIGFLLYSFYESVKEGNTKIRLSTLCEQTTLSKRELVDWLRYLKMNLDPSPIEDIGEEYVFLRELKYQYMVSPTVDFASYWEARMVKGKERIVELRPIKLLEPPSNLIKALKQYALSDGAKFEEALFNALEPLVSLTGGEIRWFGARQKFKRYVDIAWLAKIVDSVIRGKYVLICIEAKSGGSIKQLDERKVIDQIKCTLTHSFIHNRLHELSGLWIWIIDGERLPIDIDRGHGGFRGFDSTQLSFLEKLERIQYKCMVEFNRLCLVTAMNISSFIEYYKYLYSAISKAGKIDAISSSIISHFWFWSPLFHPKAMYVTIFNDPEELRPKLLYE